MEGFCKGSHIFIWCFRTSGPRINGRVYCTYLNFIKGVSFTGLDYWTEILDWNTGLDYWTEIFPFLDKFLCLF